MGTPPNPREATLPAEAAQLIAALQSELFGMKAEMGAKVSSLEETVANLAQENMLLKRRLYGNKTELVSASSAGGARLSSLARRASAERYPRWTSGRSSGRPSNSGNRPSRPRRGNHDRSARRGRAAVASR